MRKRVNLYSFINGSRLYTDQGVEGNSEKAARYAPPLTGSRFSAPLDRSAAAQQLLAAHRQGQVAGKRTWVAG